MGFKKKATTATTVVLIATITKVLTVLKWTLQFLQAAKSRSVRIYKDMGTGLC